MSTDINTINVVIVVNNKYGAVARSNEHIKNYIIVTQPGTNKTSADMYASCLHEITHLIEFQSSVRKLFEKAYELRVHVIGEKVFTCRIESQSSDKTSVDWRNYFISKTPHYAHELDQEIAFLCVKLTKMMRLSLGIIDLIVTPSSEYVFLEINSQGHWKWIEQLTELPITQEIWNYMNSETSP